MVCGLHAMSGPMFLPNRQAALALLLGCLPGPLLAQRPLEVNGLRVEYLTNPVGIDAGPPRLSWRLESTTRNTVQAAYQLQVATSEADLGRGTDLLWDSGKVSSDARLYVTSLGLYELQLNGRRVGDQLFTPGWTSYHRRLQYQTYDVTALLRPGENAIGAMLGDGWYRGYLGFNGQRNLYGRRLALRLQLEIRYQDGRTERVTSDAGWRITPGPVVGSDIYGGETYDARRERAGWSSAAYRDSAWAPVALLDAPPATLIAPVSPPVRRVRELPAVGIRQLPSGETLFDLGQNFTGWARLKVRGSAGTTVTLRFAEVLDRR